MILQITWHKQIEACLADTWVYINGVRDFAE